GLELAPVRLAAEMRARLRGVVERRLARAGERVGRRNARERTVERAAGERGAHGRVFLGGVEERHRRGSFAQVRPGNLAGLLRLPGAVEDVVGDLKRDPERQAVRAQGLVAARAEQAGRFEELARLERAAREVVLDRRLRVACLVALQ